MKRLMISLCVMATILTMNGTAWASVGSFIADSNQFGYTGSVTNVTAGTPAVPVPTSEDATVYFTNNNPNVTDNGPLSAYNNYQSCNIIESNWYESPAANHNTGFFQINEQPANQPYFGGLVTATSAVGGWTQEVTGLWDFTLTVTGVNATYANSGSRLWQPDAGPAGDAWGGTYTNYTYTITATGMQTTVSDGWLINTTNPTAITGTFNGNFVATQDYGLNPISNGDIYSVQLNFSDADFNNVSWGTGYGNESDPVYSTFAAPIPEPAAVIVWSLLGVASWIGARVVRRKRS